ncbi:MAG: hypothetical protein R3C28_02715 [Pirellulaceae bacterium]
MTDEQLQAMIPPRIREQLDEKGFITPPEFDRGHGMRTGRCLDMIRSGDLPALDMRTPGAAKPLYKILEPQICEFYRNRTVKPVASEPTDKRSPRRIKPTKNYL